MEVNDRNAKRATPKKEQWSWQSSRLWKLCVSEFHSTSWKAYLTILKFHTWLYLICKDMLNLVPTIFLDIIWSFIFSACRFPAGVGSFLSFMDIGLLSHLRAFVIFVALPELEKLFFYQIFAWLASYRWSLSSETTSWSNVSYLYFSTVDILSWIILVGDIFPEECFAIFNVHVLHFFYEKYSEICYYFDAIKNGTVSF